MEHESYKLFPPRPTLTPLLLCGIALWAAAAGSYGASAAHPAEDVLQSAVLAAVAAVPGALLCLPKASRPFGLVAVAAALGGLLGFAQAHQVLSVADRIGEEVRPVMLSVVEDSRNYGYGETARVEGSIDGVTAVFDARFGDCAPLYAGQVVSGGARFSPTDYAKDEYAWRVGSSGRLALSSVAVEKGAFPVSTLVDLRVRAIEALASSDQAALLQALVCGYRRDLTGSQEYQQFQTCGLAHLVAVSGAHLVIVAGLFATVLRAIRAPRRATVPLVIAVMAAYYVVAGMPVSALRATIMSSLGLLAFFGKRRASSQNAIGLSIVGIVLHDPTASVSASFALSALSTVGIVLFSPLFQAWIERTWLGRVPLVADSLSLTAGASLLSQLYACALFNQLPLVSPLANIVCAPLFPLVCGLGLAASLTAVAVPALAGFVQAAALLASLLSGAVAGMSRIPYACIPLSIDPVHALVMSGMGAVVLWLWWPRRPRVLAGGACGIAFTAFLALMLAGTPDQIVMLDVGQGDAFLVRSRGQTLLIDTGNHDAQLIQQLAFNRVVHLDSVLVTHADDDHCGSLDALQKTVQVDRIIVAADMLECPGTSAQGLIEQAEATAPAVVGVEAGASFSVGAFRARVVWPRAFVDEGGNADSLCIVLEYDGDDDGTVDCTALMTGDAETEQLASLLESRAVGDVDILKVGHHGSRNGMTLEQARMLAPEIALISCGANNRYGHPTQEILSMLDEVGAATFRTDQDGEVACTLTPTGVTVACIP